MRVWLLGRFEVSAGPRAVGEDGWRLRKAASLVKLLALAPYHHLHREQTMELLWPNLSPGPAANNLYQTLHAARRTLEPEAAAFRYLVLRDERLFLCPDGELWVDVDAFERAAAEARRSREPASYRRALDLYAGDLLPGDRYEEWAEERRAGLRGTYLALLLDLAALHEEDGDFNRAIAALQRAVAGDPAHEEAHAGLMRAYARSGQRYQAIRQYERLRQALRRELGVEPHAASRQAYEDVLNGQLPGASLPAIRPARDPRTHNLPGSLTSFVGRGRERAEAGRLLGTARLLTLTGPGGCGKTRLARQVATDLADAYPDGVRFAELAPLTEPGSLPQALADALGARERPDSPPVDTLANALRGKELLLILDNCEHLVEAAARLTETLLGTCPGLRILATSREPLGVAGETILQVPPLSGPKVGSRPPAEDLERYESVQLFVQRARYRNPAFVLTAQNAGAVAEICARLESLPLAIELAAARVGLSVEQVAERLDDSLGLLTEGGRTAVARQRTLRGTLDWSYDLLSGPERELFRRLSVFAGGWTLEAAEVVGPDGEVEARDVLNVLSQLGDKSLVVAEPTGDGAVRYRMLEPIRQYARERLQQAEEREAARRRHAGWCLAFVEEAGSGLRGPDQAAWVARANREHANVLAALRWSLDTEPETALRMVAILGYFWYRYGRIAEGYRLLEAVLARTEEIETPTRAKVLRLAGVLSEESGRYERAEDLHERGLELYGRLDDREGVAASLTSLGALAFAVGDLGRAVALTRESLSLKRELGDERGLMSSRNNLGEMLQTAGNLAEAQALFEENLESDRRWGDEWGTAVSLLNLGTLAIEQGEPRRAETLLLDALRTLERFGDEDAVAETLDSLAAAAGALDDGRRAATLFGAAEAARESLGTPIRPVERDRYERFVAAARRGPNEGCWASAWASGRALSLKQAAGLALSPHDEPPSTTANAYGRSAGQTSASLTPREHEVALLAARGLSNRRISEELSISQNTAATHVGRVLKKLGLRSRSQIGARLLREHHGLPDPD